MIEMVLEDVVVRVDSGDATKIVWDQRMIVLREKRGDRALPIWMGAGEGNALAVQLRDAPPPRPLTADLMAEVVRVLGGRVERAAVTRLDEMTFYATVTVDGQELDARPSDAINLAVRTGAPILVAADVLESAGLVGDALEAAKWDCAVEQDLPEGTWSSLSAELLAALHRMPR